jgi:hypothetical protein
MFFSSMLAGAVTNFRGLLPPTSFAHRPSPCRKALFAPALGASKGKSACTLCVFFPASTRQVADVALRFFSICTNI